MKGVGGGGVNNYQVPLGIPPPPLVGVINGTAVLIAQYWGECYFAAPLQQHHHIPK
jgi:hypothetical protein